MIKNDIHYSGTSCGGMKGERVFSDIPKEVTCKRCKRIIALRRHGQEIPDGHPDAIYFKIRHLRGITCQRANAGYQYCTTNDPSKVNCVCCRKMIRSLTMKQVLYGFVAVRVGRGILKNNMEYASNLDDSGVMILSDPFNFNRSFQEDHKHFDFTIDIKHIRKNRLNSYMIPDESYKIKKVA